MLRWRAYCWGNELCYVCVERGDQNVSLSTPGTTHGACRSPYQVCLIETSKIYEHLLLRTDSRAAGILDFCYAEFRLYVIRATLLDCSLISNKLRLT